MKTTFLKLLSFVLFTTLLITSCNKDDENPETGTAPIITLISGDENEDRSMLPEETFTMTFRGEKGTVNMNRLRVDENGALVANERLLFDDEEEENPVLLVNNEENIFTKDITFKANTIPGTYDLKVIILDGATPPKTAEYTFEYTVSEPDLNEITGELFNAALSENAGGLNLLTGGSIGDDNSSAHIKDMGNGGNPITTWNQKIAPVINNGVSLRILSSAVDYDDVQFSSQVKALYNEGTEVGSSGTTENTKVGDTFVARKGENYFLFTIKEVNITTLGNEDHFKIAIKR